MQQKQRALSDTGPGANTGNFAEPSSQVTFTYPHLKTLTELALTRFPSEEAEVSRIAEIRPVLEAAHRLQRSLENHTHYLLVDHRGTPGLNDLGSAAQQLLDALAAYAHTLRELSEGCSDSATHSRIQIYRGAPGSGDQPVAASHVSDDS